MEIKSSVGRRNGNHSRNRASDQKIVQDLLNQIPVSEGGGGNALRERMVEGMCTDGLYNAILKFQKKHLPKFADGRVDPDGPTFQALLQMSGYNQAVKSTAQLIEEGWGVLQSASRQLAVEEAKRAEDFRKYRSSVEAMTDNPYRYAALSYLDALAAKSGQTTPVLPAEIVLFGRAHLQGNGYPPPSPEDSWEADWSTFKVVRPKSYYKYYNGLGLRPFIKIEISDNDRAIALFKNGGAINMTSGMHMALFPDKVGVKNSTMRTHQERQDLKEKLKVLDGVR